MIYCGNAAAQIFLNKLAEEMAKSNEYFQSNEYPIDIPFYISILWQRIKEHPEKYTDFLKDITYESNYEICQKTPCDPSIWMVRVFRYSPTIFDNKVDEDWSYSCDYEYEIKFSCDERWWGYCECKSGDEDYRDDHKCCGHGCDWIAPTVSISKCYDYDYGTWNGDEHDYWDFEDSFYKDEIEVKAKKEEEEKRLRIEQLEKEMADCKKELDKLKNGGDE